MLFIFINIDINDGNNILLKLFSAKRNDTFATK